MSVAIGRVCLSVAMYLVSMSEALGRVSMLKGKCVSMSVAICRDVC
jgi:hypothetical protein